MTTALFGVVPALLAANAFSDSFLLAAAAIALGMLVWDTVEVGRNDAANLVNAVFGSGVMSRGRAVFIAGIGVVLGATAASPVMETARKGIFDPTALTIMMALSVYVSVYIVDTVLLYSYSAFGMPVSTTACLVFELLGAAFVVGWIERGDLFVVSWGTAGKVVFAIFCSIFVTGVGAFIIQRVLRGVMGQEITDIKRLRFHGGWIAGGLLAGLVYFMIVKGMKHVAWIKYMNKEVIHAYPYGPAVAVLALWVLFAIITHILLASFRQRAANLLFPVLAVIGMFCMAFAFGQNDLANCASPGLAAMQLIGNWEAGVVEATSIPLPLWALAGCGLLLVLGMTTRNAQRVTRAEVHAGSMANNVSLYAPKWCLWIARNVLRRKASRPLAAAVAQKDTTEALRHYDPMRAAVILGVAASVIATASGFGLPVSTTYVAFAAVVATGVADRMFSRGDADVKTARMIWVVFSWFAAAVIAACAAGVVCWIVYKTKVFGIVLGVGANLTVRWYLAKRADEQERRTEEEAKERLAAVAASEHLAA